MSIAPGSFVRPVGLYTYCLRVDSVTPADDSAEWGPEPERWSCTRFGLAEDRNNPVDDGHVQRGHSLSSLVEVAPGVWRRPDGRGWSSDVLYYREMAPRGQQELFQ